MLCPKCGKLNSQSSNFCNNCGKKLNQIDRTSKRGFASMEPEKRFKIAQSGGVAAHKKGSAHQFTSEEASAAGKKGGKSRKKS